MKRASTLSVAIVALLIPAGAAFASSAPEYSPLALDVVGDMGPDVLFTASEGGGEDGFASAPPSRTRFESVRYRPRRARARYPRDDYDRPRATTVSQFHAGFFDPDGEAETGFVLGFRGGISADPHVQVGLGLDWQHKSDSQTALVSEEPGPGGTTIIVRRDLARSSFNMFPAMVYAQLSAGNDLPVIPYFGVAGAYEVLFLSAEDFQTGEEFDGTFSGFGWQAWGGLGFPLSGQSRLTGEVFVNGAELSRDVEDAVTGETFRETIDMDGVGMRFGVSWGF